jgi:hypothetical protein
MEVNRRYFPKILLDNEAAYFAHMEGICNSVDELACMEITRTTHSYHFRIAPSIPLYAQSLLHEILKLNTIYGIQLDLSKSIRTSSTISFNIELPE